MEKAVPRGKWKHRGPVLATAKAAFAPSPPADAPTQYDGALPSTVAGQDGPRASSRHGAAVEPTLQSRARAGMGGGFARFQRNPPPSGLNLRNLFPNIMKFGPNVRRIRPNVRKIGRKYQRFSQKYGRLGRKYGVSVQNSEDLVQSSEDFLKVRKIRSKVRKIFPPVPNFRRKVPNFCPKVPKNRSEFSRVSPVLPQNRTGVSRFRSMPGWEAVCRRLEPTCGRWFEPVYG